MTDLPRSIADIPEALRQKIGLIFNFHVPVSRWNRPHGSVKKLSVPQCLRGEKERSVSSGSCRPVWARTSLRAAMRSGEPEKISSGKE